MTRVRQFSGQAQGLGGGYVSSRVVDVVTVGADDVIVDPATPLSGWSSSAPSVDVTTTLPLVPTEIAAGQAATVRTGMEMRCRQDFVVRGNAHVLGDLSIGYDNGRIIVVAPHSDFDWVPGGFSYSGLQIVGDIDPWDYAESAFAGLVDVFVDSTKANDTGNGLTWATAKKTFDAAKAITNRGIIYVKPGTYQVTGGTISPGTSGRTHTAIIACGTDGAPSSSPGLVRLVNSDGAVTWTADGGAYKAAYTRSSVEVRDLLVPDPFGRAMILTLAADAAGCQAAEGTYFLDDPGNLLWVHRVGGIAPDGDLVVTGAAQVCYLGGYTYYMRAIETAGGTLGLNNAASADCNVYLDACAFGNASTNGLGLQQFGQAFLRNVICRYNSNDGFNYARAAAVGTCRVLELDCESHNNGVVGGATHDGSSAHNSVVVARIRGEYHHCWGKGCVDVDTTKCWNLGVIAHDTRTLTAGSKRDFQVDGEGWLDRCVSYGSDSSVAGTGPIYSRRCSFGGTLETVPTPY